MKSKHPTRAAIRAQNNFYKQALEENKMIKDRIELNEDQSECLKMLLNAHLKQRSDLAAHAFAHGVDYCDESIDLTYQILQQFHSSPG